MIKRRQGSMQAKSESLSEKSPEKSIIEMVDSFATLEDNIITGINEQFVVASPGS